MVRNKIDKYDIKRKPFVLLVEDSIGCPTYIAIVGRDPTIRWWISTTDL